MASIPALKPDSGKEIAGMSEPMEKHTPMMQQYRKPFSFSF
jgi:hypothetical protein